MRLSIILILFILAACTTTKVDEPSEEISKAQQIVNTAIEASGGERYLKSTVKFDFRDRSYIGTRDGGIFRYERLFADSLGNYRDVLNNEGFTRYLNDEVVNVIDTMAQKYTNSVNSVLYFALLPYGLNDAAVNKEYLGEIEMGGNNYDKVKVTFGVEGGGVDYQDVFVYWVNKENGYVDFFGYTYETDGGGVRFRESYNAQIVNGIRFQDYINYKPEDGDTTSILDYDKLFEEGKLIELSKIELKNIQVQLN